MEINTEVTKEDYAEFNKYYFMKRNFKKLFVWTVIISLILPYTFDNNDELVLYDFLFYLVVFNSIFWLIMYVSLNMSKNIPLKNGLFIGVRKYVFNEDEIICESDKYKMILKWKAIVNIEVNSKAIYLFVDKIAAYIIPNRVFDDEKGQAAFIDMIQTKLNTIKNI